MNILHISDVHFGRDYARYSLKEPLKRRKIILTSLIERIKELDQDLRPEHIVFTGDIAWHGLDDEFADALKWFKSLISEIGLTGADISFVPGNHDIDWSQGRRIYDINDNSVDKIDEIYKYENAPYIEATLEAYNHFCQNMGVTPYQYPCGDRTEYSYSMGYKDIHSDSGETVRLLAFNTSGLTGHPHISEEKNWLGLPQLQAMINNNLIIQAPGVDYTIALFHHSTRFLHPNETNSYSDRPSTMIFLQQYVNLLLYGHTESMGYPVMLKQSGGGTMIPGGAIYYNDDHKHTFNMLYINAKNKKLGCIPYIYDGLWKEHDYIPATIERKPIKAQKLTEENLDGCRLIMQSDHREKIMELPLLKALYDSDGNLLEIHNRCNVNRVFDVTIIDCSHSSGAEAGNLSGNPSINLSGNLSDNLSGNPSDNIQPEKARLNISLSLSKKCRVKPLLAEADFLDFYGQDKNTQHSFVLEDANGRAIVNGTDISFAEGEHYKRRLLEILDRIQDEMGANFYVDHNSTNKDNRNLMILNDFMTTGYSERFFLSGDVFMRYNSLEQLTDLYEHINQAETVALSANKNILCELYGVKLRFPNARVIAGPVELHMDWVKNKIAHYSEGDSYQYTCKAEEIEQVRVVVDEKKYILNRPNETSLPLVDAGDIPVIIV